MSTYEPLFHALMAIVLEGYSRVIVAISAEVLLQKHKAISKLRALLTRSDAVADDGAILTMLYLSVSLRADGPLRYLIQLTQVSTAA